MILICEAIDAMCQDETKKLPMTCLKTFPQSDRSDFNFDISTSTNLNLILRFDVPEDGLPTIEDWLTTFHSILLDGLELNREPLDVSV